MTADVTTAQAVRRAGHGASADRRCTLDYEARFLRRKMLTDDTGASFLVDLPQTVSVEDGDAFELADGQLVAVAAAEETLLEIVSDHLLPLVWHIGNRHCPAQIEHARVLVQPDHVIRDLMEKLGATVREVHEPFTPEGGAYGHGRTHSHAH